MLSRSLFLLSGVAEFVAGRTTGKKPGRTQTCKVLRLSDTGVKLWGKHGTWFKSQAIHPLKHTTIDRRQAVCVRNLSK